MSAKVNVWAVVPAAGSGSRMQQRTPKQYVSIADKTVLEHSIEVLLSNIELSVLIVCVPDQDDTALRLINAMPYWLIALRGKNCVLLRVAKVALKVC